MKKFTKVISIIGLFAMFLLSMLFLEKKNGLVKPPCKCKDSDDVKDDFISDDVIVVDDDVKGDDIEPYPDLNPCNVWGKFKDDNDYIKSPCAK